MSNSCLSMSLSSSRLLVKCSSMVRMFCDFMDGEPVPPGFESTGWKSLPGVKSQGSSSSSLCPLEEEEEHDDDDDDDEEQMLGSPLLLSSDDIIFGMSLWSLLLACLVSCRISCLTVEWSKTQSG